MPLPQFSNPAVSFLALLDTFRFHVQRFASFEALHNLLAVRFFSGSALHFVHRLGPLISFVDHILITLLTTNSCSFLVW